MVIYSIEYLRYVLIELYGGEVVLVQFFDYMVFVVEQVFDFYRMVFFCNKIDVMFIVCKYCYNIVIIIKLCIKLICFLKFVKLWLYFYEICMGL